MGAPFWAHWCRLCAKDSDELKLDLKNLDHDIVDGMQKYFEVKVRFNDNLTTKLCSCCYNLLNELIQFSRRVSKAQTIFEVLRFFDTNKAVDIKALREHWGLEEFDLTLESHVERKTNVVVPEFIDVQNVSGNEDIQDEKNVKNKEAVEIAVGNKRNFDEQDILGLATDSDIVNSLVSINKDIESPAASSPERGARSECSSTEESDNDDDDDWTMPTASKKPLKAHLPLQVSDNHQPHATKSNNNSKDVKEAPRNTSDDFEKCLDHLKDDETECNLCGKSYYTSYHHECKAKNKNSKAAICQYCNKTLSCVKGLRLHIQRIHENKRPFVCSLCDKGFKTLKELKNHRFAHTEERPHLCPICNKGFKKKAQLKNHSQSHGEPKGQCDICGKKVQTKLKLRVHKLTHEAPQHKCDYCGKLAVRPHTLKYHMLLHLGIKPFLCKYCQKAFTSRRLCIQHIQKEHPKEYEQDEDKELSSSIPIPHFHEVRQMIREMVEADKK